MATLFDLSVEVAASMVIFVHFKCCSPTVVDGRSVCITASEVLHMGVEVEESWTKDVEEGVCVLSLVEEGSWRGIGEGGLEQER